MYVWPNYNNWYDQDPMEMTERIPEYRYIPCFIQRCTRRNKYTRCEVVPKNAITLYLFIYLFPQADDVACSWPGTNDIVSSFSRWWCGRLLIIMNNRLTTKESPTQQIMTLRLVYNMIALQKPTYDNCWRLRIKVCRVRWLKNVHLLQYHVLSIVFFGRQSNAFSAFCCMYACK